MMRYCTVDFILSFIGAIESHIIQTPTVFDLHYRNISVTHDRKENCE